MNRYWHGNLSQDVDQRNADHDEVTCLPSVPAKGDFLRRKFILLSQKGQQDLLEISGKEGACTNHAGSSMKRLGSRPINKVGYAFTLTLLRHSLKKQTVTRTMKGRVQI